jgi:myosin heavy subunit
MEIILASVAILLSFLAFYVARSKASKRALEEVRSRNSELQTTIGELQKQLNSIQDKSSQGTPALAQTASSSSEITMLKTELGCIRRDLQANSQKLSIHSQAIDAIQAQQSVSSGSGSTPVEPMEQQQNPFGGLSQPTQDINPFPSLATFPGLAAEQPIQPAEGYSTVQNETTQPEPYEQLVQQYQGALDRGDRQALRQMQVKELNITSDSEEILLRGSSDEATKLQAVLGGGSYMLVNGEGQYWLFPTAQTLDSFSMNQPQKGIFGYESEMLSKPVVKKPAEVREESDHWVVVEKGIISVPG